MCGKDFHTSMQKAQKAGILMDRILENSILLDRRYSLLLEDLDRTKHDLDSAYTNLANAVEPDLIDCYIYEVQSVQMRYQFLLGRVKQIEDSYAKNPLPVSVIRQVSTNSSRPYV